MPGDYAAAEARKALSGGLDVMIFSDNVPLAEEVALKREGKALGRLVLGPDCGTAIIAGTPLAFANRVPSGDIGLIGASGTGLQEVSCLIAAAGRGISHAIGVGSRDLGREVGGLSTLAAIDLLDADPATARIVLISKPPHPEVVAAVLARVGRSRKRFTLCFLGAVAMELPRNASAAGTLSAAAEDVLGSAIAAAPATSPVPAARDGLILGLYAGGSLAAEAQLVLIAAGRQVASNAAVPGAETLEAAAPRLDRIIDLGADEFTRGRPHPMIDPAVRSNKLRRALADPNVAVILIDIVLGLGAHPDPAREVAAVLAGAPTDRPHLVASVTGTEADPQVRSRQIATLKAAGVRACAIQCPRRRAGDRPGPGLRRSARNPHAAPLVRCADPSASGPASRRRQHRPDRRPGAACGRDGKRARRVRAMLLPRPRFRMGLYRPRGTGGWAAQPGLCAVARRVTTGALALW